MTQTWSETITIEHLHALWEQVQELNLDVGLKQETIDDVQSAIQKKLDKFKLKP